MSVLLRGLLSIFFVLLIMVILISQNQRKVPFHKQCRTLILYMACIFPFLEFGKVLEGFKLNALYLGIVWLFVLNAKRFKVFFCRKFMWVNGFCIFCFISALFSDSVAIGVIGALKYTIMAYYALLTYEAASHTDVEKFGTRLFSVIAIWIGIFAFIQIFVNPEFTLFYTERSSVDRMALCFDNAQSAGLGAGWVVIFFLNKYILGKKYKTCFLMLVCIFILIAMFTGSKSAIMGICGGFLLTLWYSKIKLSNFLLILMIVLGGAYTYPYWSQMSIVERMLEFDQSLEIREELFWGVAYTVFLAHWFIGIGPGCFQEYNKNNLDLVHKDMSEESYATQPESGYLLWMDEFGVFALWPLLIIFSLFRLKTKQIFNFSFVVPWLFAFVSFANTQREMIAFMLTMILGLIYASNQSENKRSSDHLVISSTTLYS